MQRDQCCHTAGSIAFDAKGNLYLSTGDNTNPHATRLRADRRAAGARSVGRAEVVGEHERSARQDHPHPPRARRQLHDSRREPVREGDAEDAAGDLHDGAPQSRTASRWTSARASCTGATSGPTRRRIRRSAVPPGHDEVNQARRAGNFGWPYFVGDNKAYYDYDFATKTPGKQFDPGASGERVAEQHRPARSCHRRRRRSSGIRPRSPRSSRSSRAAAARRWPAQCSTATDFRNAARPFPAYYDGKLLRLRVDARMGHGRHHEREGRLRVDGAVHAEPEVQQSDRAGVLAER